jgi:glutamine amidotransferase
MSDAPGPRIAIVDYGMGNRRSVQKAFAHVGAIAEISRDPSELERADALVVPGVGAFPTGMRRLDELGLADLIRARARAATPVLGICLGMQLLFDASSELEPTAGLGLIAGEVRPLAADGLRVPHIGWNEVRFQRPSPLLEQLPANGCPFYHVHSYVAEPDDPGTVIGTTEYGERFPTIVARGSIVGVQFHPEKSSRHGLAMLSTFAALTAARTGAMTASGAQA